MSCCGPVLEGWNEWNNEEHECKNYSKLNYIRLVFTPNQWNKDFTQKWDELVACFLQNLCFLRKARCCQAANERSTNQSRSKDSPRGCPQTKTVVMSVHFSPKPCDSCDHQCVVSGLTSARSLLVLAHIPSASAPNMQKQNLKPGKVEYSF